MARLLAAAAVCGYSGAMDLLVSTQWLADHLGEAGLTVVDSTVFLPGSGRSARSEYEQRHIPGARFLDIDELVDRENPAPHMLPPASRFAEAMRAGGIG